MKTKQEIRKELIKEFGENFNTIDNLIKWLKQHYHPTFFNNMNEFVKCHVFGNCSEMTVDEYTDDIVTEEDCYIIILFDDHRDFKGAIQSDNFYADAVISYDNSTRKILNSYYTGWDNEFYHYIDAFIE